MAQERDAATRPHTRHRLIPWSHSAARTCFASPSVGAILSWPARCQGPLSHGRALLLVAQHQDGSIAGALTASPLDWIVTHPGITGEHNQAALFNRLGTAHGVAVDEPYGGQGIAAALIAEAERHLARQGYGLITMDHKPKLTDFYARLGYAHGAQIVIHTPGPLIAQPAHQVRTYLMSATHNWSGREAVKLRSTRSGGRGADGSGTDAAPLPADDALDAQLPHQPLDCAPGHLDALAARGAGDPPGPIGGPGLGVDLLDQRQKLLVTESAGGLRPLLAGEIGRR
ncbi:GNAT family N-acetyltransferase [Streptomyces sp. AK02-04a]|nr:GNAT family N-acetyltransferase [Streptomyces sp. AK02-04a]MDX3764039.1 GNAT family N-acetyltransferase [Streptomyces sp. AK02-04a]